MRLLSVVGARPQFIKLKPMSDAILAAGIEHRIAHTGQHYDPQMSDVFFRGLDLPPADWNLQVGSGSHAEQTAVMMTGLERLLLNQSFDWVLAYGDTNSTLAAAVAAAKLNVRVAHVEAGLRSRNRGMPEEINRVLTDHAADLLLAPTASALDNLTAEGLGDKSRLVGDVMADLLMSLGRKADARRSRALDEIAQQVDGRPYIVATIHRASNTDDPAQLNRLLSGLSSIHLPVVLVAHPRLRAAATRHGLRLDSRGLHVVDPLDYLEMLSLVAMSSGVVTDSGGLQKEAYLLGVVCTTLRSETEWSETLQGGMNILDPTGDRLTELAARETPGGKLRPYGDGNASQRIVHELQNYD